MKRLLGILSSLLAASLLSVAAVSAQEATETPPTEIAEKADTYLTDLVESGFSGAILIAIDGEIVLHKGYGMADREEGIPNTADTAFWIGSINKMFTRAAIYKLEDEGLLNFDDSIGQYLDDVPEDKADITIQQLLDHTAGFPHALSAPTPMSLMTFDEVLDKIMEMRLVAEPGSTYLYSNVGFTLLAVLVQTISGQTYQDYLRENFLIPASMTDTGFEGDNYEGKPIAHGENSVLGYSTPDTWGESWVRVGAGTMISTVGDLYKWHLALETDPFLLRVFPNEGGRGEAGGATFTSFSADYEYITPLDIVVIGLSNGAAHHAEDVILGGLLELVVGRPLRFEQ